MSAIRYKLDHLVWRFGLSLLADPDDEPSVVTVLHFPSDFAEPVFVDILETRGPRWLKLRVYMPNGETGVGWHDRTFVALHVPGNVFDGRFNALASAPENR